jgi:hypothetical protein
MMQASEAMDFDSVLDVGPDGRSVRNFKDAGLTVVRWANRIRGNVKYREE